MAINATIQVRRGLLKDFDPTKMLPGEWAVSIDASTSNQIVWMCFAPGVCKRMGTYEDFQNMVYNATGQIIERYEDAFNSILEEVKSNAETTANNTDIVLVAKSDIINTYLPQIRSYVSNASASASEAKTYSENAKASASEADKSAEDAKKYSQNAFSTTPEGYEALVGDVDVLKNSIIQTTDRTLYGSKEGGIKLIGIGGASEQGENPSPDYPQEIESVGDLKNLAKIESFGLLTSNTNRHGYEWLDMKGGKYSITVTNSDNYTLYVGYKHGDSITNVGSVTNNSQVFTFDISDGDTILCWYGSGVVTNYVTQIQLEKGNPTPYRPYGFGLVIKAEGKNRYNPTTSTKGLINQDGSFDNNEAYRTTDFIEVKDIMAFSGIITGETWLRISVYDENKNFIKRVDRAIYEKNIILAPADIDYAKYIRVSFEDYSARYITDFQIEYNDVVTPYEPYRSKSITIPLNEPLRKGDEIVVVDDLWGKDKGRRKIVFDGSDDEAWTLVTDSGNQFAITISDNGARDFLCTHFRNSGVSNWASVPNGTYMVHPTKFEIVRFRYDTVATVDDWKAWLADNPITVEYELATPIFEPFTDQTPFYGLESFDTVTYISTDSEVEPNVILKYGKVEASALALENYNRTKRNEIHISELMALQTELSAAVVAGSEG